MQLGPPKVFSDAFQNAARDIHVVKDGEADEETRERVVHLLSKKHRDDHTVGEESKGACGVKKSLFSIDHRRSNPKQILLVTVFLNLTSSYPSSAESIMTP